MTHLLNGTVATDLENDSDNRRLAEQGYTVRHIETWHDQNQSCIVCDAPTLTEHDLPY